MYPWSGLVSVEGDVYLDTSEQLDFSWSPQYIGPFNELSLTWFGPHETPAYFSSFLLIRFESNIIAVLFLLLSLLS